MGIYLRPRTIEEALAALAADGPVVLAGGTDFYPARVGRALDEGVIDITAIESLRRIAEAEDHWRIGATATWRDIADARLPGMFDGLKLAAREVGGAQIQNTGTIAGNLCHASPAADGVPALLALDARIELRSATATRTLRLSDFVLGNRRTARRGDELVSAILVPRRSTRATGHFLKLGARRYLVISIVMAAGMVDVDGEGRIVTAGVAVGACSEVAQRLPALERALLGQRLEVGLDGLVDAAHVAPLQPLDDVRASADYRLDAALTLTRRLLRDLAAKSTAVTA